MVKNILTLNMKRDLHKEIKDKEVKLVLILYLQAIRKAETTIVIEIEIMEDILEILEIVVQVKKREIIEFL